MMEAVILLPILLGAFLAAGQFAHIWYARQMVRYAAYSGSRAAARAGDAGAEVAAKDAARRACAMISLTAKAESAGTDAVLPYIGTAAGSKDVDAKMNVTLEQVSGHYTAVTVRMDFPLVFPVVNRLLAGLNGAETNDVFPHIRLEETALTPKQIAITD